MVRGWVELGQPYAAFWTITLREYDLITRGAIKARDAEFEARRVLNQELAKLIAYAYHDPAKMPDFTKSRTARERPEMGEAEAKERLRAHLISMHFTTGKGQ